LRTAFTPRFHLSSAITVCRLLTAAVFEKIMSGTCTQISNKDALICRAW